MDRVAGRVVRRAMYQFSLVLWLGLALGAQAAQPVDYPAQLHPIFARSCNTAFCHGVTASSGVDLRSYTAAMASVGEQYGAPIVVPGNSSASPLVEKLTADLPRFGIRMPRNAPALSPFEIALIARWIDEGAKPATISGSRGDVDRSGDIDIADAIRVMDYLFLGGAAPSCLSVADGNGDQDLDLSDVIFILGYLFLGGRDPSPLSVDEALACVGAGVAPVAQPIGTVVGREGVLLEFQVSASDADGDALRFQIESGPEGLVIDESTGTARWTPGFGQAGDHRIRVRVADRSTEALSAIATGLVRVLDGNRPPDVQAIGTRYGREGVPLALEIAASDVEGDALRFALVAGPPGASLDGVSGLLRWVPGAGSAGEHALTVRVVDDGLPPQATEVQGRIVVVAANSPVNQPPFVLSRDVYRTFPGKEIRFRIGAVDPDGHGLEYSAETLPAGASLDRVTGLFAWTPSSEQIGPHYVPFAVTDTGLPPETAGGTLVFRVAPLDSCATLVCDPATGCRAELPPLTTSCCAGEPPVRAGEPVAPCPEGRVLHVGRNVRGFGRLQNCDRLQLVSFAQGGVTVRFHIEARCINGDQAVRVRMKLETPLGRLFDGERSILVTPRADGFFQRLGLVSSLDSVLPLAQLDGADALLTVQLTDLGGVVVEEKLRLKLTLDDLPDLPEPDVQDVASGEAGCVGCHRPVGPTGHRAGIEDAHPWFQLSCTDCHGGEPLASTRLEAHVPAPAGTPPFLRNLTSDQLDRVSQDYLRFVNPGDNRVAKRGCGSSSPAAGGTSCHQTIVESLPLLVMSTYAGHYTLPRFLAGGQGREPIHAAVDVVDSNFDPHAAPPGAVASLSALREPEAGTDRATLKGCMDVYLPKTCPTCHLADFGRNNANGNFRSSGCTACHMVYGDDGRSHSADPMLSKDFPPHPAKHQLTSAIPTEQCAHCHFQGGRIGLSYRGIREGGFPPEKTPPNAVPLGRELHDHDSRYYFTDEDDTNDFDETPPDVHHAAGMVCADCHVGPDVHGDGSLYPSERYQVGIRCQDCHGTVRDEARSDPADGLFKNSRGAPLRHLRRAADQRVLLRLSTQDRELEVPQVHRILQSGVNQAANEAMGVNERGFSHADSMECYSCHSGWRLTCFGCHVTVDDTKSAPNRTTGESTPGVISVRRVDYSNDFFALGLNREGKITPLCSSMTLYMSYVDKDGVKRFTDQPRTSAEGRLGFGWNPLHHHTVSRVPVNCDRCHPVAPGAGPDNTQTLRETYGFGNGKFLYTGGDGVTRDHSAFLDAAGELEAEFPHPNTGPVPKAVREKAMSIRVVPHPRR